MENYEERYKEALERAKKMQENSNGMILKKWLWGVFPELKECEDEKIRGAIIHFISHTPTVPKGIIDKKTMLAWLEKQKDYIKFPNSAYTSNKDVIEFANKYSHTVWGKLMDNFKIIENYSIGCNDVSDIVLNAIINTYNWLEKQGKQQGISALEAWKDMRLEVYQQASGNRHEPNYSDDSTKMFSLNDIDEIIEKISEQKLDDKVEPKFKPGDWIIFNGLILHIDEVVNGYYRTTSRGDGIHNSYDWDIDNAARLWTIQDAKDGNVLVDEDNNIGIYLGKKDDSDWHSCIYLGCDNRLRGFSIGGYHNNKNTKPATKEQRDLLFQKMKEAGYEWDAEKKEVKTIEQKPAESTKDYNDIDPHFGILVEDLMSTDKTESKFKAGNWYQCTKDFFGKGVTFDKNTAYYCAMDGCLQNEYGCHIAIVENLYDNFKLWTIQDAKDGDVLINWNNTTFIFKAIEDGTVKFHIAYNERLNTIATPLTNLSHQGLAEPQFEFHPAAKEQCNTLFAKMKDAGYEWDNEKKELKKIEPKKLDVWNAEDEQNLNVVLSFIPDECLRRWLQDKLCYDTLDADDILPYLGNNQVQDILEDMGMLDDNGHCPHTAEEIFKAGMEHAFNLNREAASSVKIDIKNI